MNFNYGEKHCTCISKHGGMLRIGNFREMETEWKQNRPLLWVFQDSEEDAQGNLVFDV